MFIEPNGYTDCVGCGEVAFAHVLCDWCQEGAREYNCDPDSVYDAEFDEGNLASWAYAGGLLADEEEAKAAEGYERLGPFIF